MAHRDATFRPRLHMGHFARPACDSHSMQGADVHGRVARESCLGAVKNKKGLQGKKAEGALGQKVARIGVEPMTLALLAPRSNQLS